MGSFQMGLNWFLYAVISVLLWSVAAIILKYIRVNYIKSTLGYLILTNPVCLLGLVLLAFGRFHLPSIKIILLIVAVGIIGVTAYWLYIIVIQKEELSRVITLYNATPIVTLILATVFLKEVLTIKDYLAFPLVIIGSVLISVRRTKKRYIFFSGTMLIIASIVLYAIQNLLLKSIAEVDFVSMMIIRWFSISLILGIVFLTSKKMRDKTKENFRQLDKKNIMLMYTAEALGMIGLVFSYLAIQKGLVSLVTLIQGSESLFVIIVTAIISVFMPYILKEETSIKTIILKILSALLIIGGLCLLVI